MEFVLHTHTHTLTSIIVASEEEEEEKEDDDAPEHRVEIFAHVQANNNIMTQGVTKPSKIEQKIKL